MIARLGGHGQNILFMSLPSGCKLWLSGNSLQRRFHRSAAAFRNALSPSVYAG
jgi:hypothetical protein